MRHSRLNIIFTILVIFVAPQSFAQTQLQTFVYECESSEGFTVSLKDESAWVFFSKQTVQLPQVPFGSGAKYSDGTIAYWANDEEATLEMPDKKYENCRINRSKSIWEDAKLRGVDFRATGNEPGWYMEISQNTQILIVADYGQNRYEFTASSPLTDPAARTTTYSAQNDQQPLSVLLEGRRCTDSMSGQQFETTVTVKLNEKKYRGCGRALH